VVSGQWPVVGAGLVVAESIIAGLGPKNGLLQESGCDACSGINLVRVG
jgi:hypothetical protein